MLSVDIKGGFISPEVGVVTDVCCVCEIPAFYLIFELVISGVKTKQTIVRITHDVYVKVGSMLPAVESCRIMVAFLLCKSYTRVAQASSRTASPFFEVGQFCDEILFHENVSGVRFFQKTCVGVHV